MPDLLSSRLRTNAEPKFQQDWQRQRRTAADILQRLKGQEGIILADQVGMGKTFVALAVAVSQILAAPELGQVVVFVPAAVADKWVREWQKFSTTLLEPGSGIRCVEKPIRSGEDFLKELDDPPSQMNHVLVVTHTALTTTLKDAFVQLALLHYATRRIREGAALRQRIAKWSTGRSGLIRHAQFTPDRVTRLLATAPAKWASLWKRLTGEELDDDPVPAALNVAARAYYLDELREVMGELPMNRSADIAKRLERARKQLSEITQSTWKWMLSSTDLHLPLLIVDEAHRLKNDDTRISKLFAERSDDEEDAGAFDGIFDRMLFLTATPFELGHDELVNVLRRMKAAREQVEPPLDKRLETLREVLSAAQISAITLDAAWGRLKPEDLASFGKWTVDAVPPAGANSMVREAWEHAQYAVRARHTMHAKLKQWVIRHERPHRRDYHPGRFIINPGSAPGGIEIPESAALPFLLAARAQSVAVDEQGPGQRPLFAYGIASSYEAFRRLKLDDPKAALDSDTPTDDRSETQDTISAHAPATTSAVEWYRTEIDRCLNDDATRNAHPKIQATVQRAAELWLEGEKCLIFCWFIKTGEAVERALVKRVGELTMKRAAAALGTSNDQDAKDELDRISDRLLRRDVASYERFRGRLTEALVDHCSGHQEVLDLVLDAVIRHLRTPGYLVRYTLLKPDMAEGDLWAGINGKNLLKVDVLDRWKQFAQRLATARSRAGSADPEDEMDTEFNRIRAAVVGAYREEDATFTRGASLDPVRRASGKTQRQLRERLIALFNTPFAPDLLVASSVMGEGIDLHQECRHVIHHDLDWNPRVLEQRTGRLDRIGSLAERTKQQIEVYEPYLAGTHDEKMYRVVKDRAQWFDVVMGRSKGVEEDATNHEEHRVPIHQNIRNALSLDLRSPE